MNIDQIKVITAFKMAVDELKLKNNDLTPERWKQVLATQKKYYADNIPHDNVIIDGHSLKVSANDLSDSIYAKLIRFGFEKNGDWYIKSFTE